MGYTMSFEASVKVQRGQVSGLLRHNGRDVDKAQGREVRHANQDIDPARTADNETLVSDGQGSWRSCGDLGEIEAALDARLQAVGKPLRKDAVVLRPLVLQLDPAWYAAHQSDGEREQAASDMLEWAADTFGAENIIYASLHNDENAPHLHIGFCPVTEDGRLSQKDWFSGPAQLRKMHQDLRQHMTDAGYDIDMENRKPGKHAKRMSVQEYKDFQDLQTEARKIDTQQGQLDRWAGRLHEEQADLQEQRRQLDEERKAVEAREKAVEARERLLEAKEAKLSTEAQKAAEEAVEAVIAGRVKSDGKSRREAAKEAAAAAMLEALGTADDVEQKAAQQKRQVGSKTLSPV